MSSTYSEKIKELRSTAQETQAAIKIQDKLNELKSKDVEISSYRWIWELIQNAKDCTNSSGKIDIQIVFDSARRILEFKHNGKLFATKNIVYLIEQVSTKERSRNTENTGKFGTGFLTTNLLSPIITISGLLHDDDEINVAHFQVTIDRSGKTLDELKEAIKQSCDQLEANTESISCDVDDNAMNTTFTYNLDDNGVDVARVGLENFLITAPYVFAFVSELNTISVTNNGELTVYTREKEGTTQSENTFVSRIMKNGSDNVINIFTIQNESLMLAAEIKQYNQENHIVCYSKKLPRLFCDFPLLGTHDFVFPVVINSRGFDPTEPRNGIFLYGDNGTQNKQILKDACTLYESMLEYFIQNGYKDIYNIVCLPPVESKDWIDKEWYVNEIVEVLKSKIQEMSMFHMLDDSIRSLSDEWLYDDKIYLSSDDNKELRYAVWELSSKLFPDMHICKNEIEEWYSSLWEECRNYGINDLIQRVEGIGSLSELQEKNVDPIEWLNALYKLIHEKCGTNSFVSIQEKRIFPNQNGNFCSIGELKSDSGIDEVYKDAATQIGVDLRAELANSRISFVTFNQITFNDAAYRLLNKAQEYGTKPAQFYKLIIGFIKEQNPKQCNLISIYNELYPLTPIVTAHVHFIYDKLVNEAIEYWCRVICMEIDRCSNLADLKTAFPSISGNAEIWISNFIEYLIAIEQTELLEKYSIIPNQNGIFCKKSSLYKESDSIPEFMKTVCRVAGSDIKEDLVSNSIEVSKIIPRKKGFKDIAEIITNYVRKNMNNISVEDDDKEAFNQTYKWLRAKKDDPIIRQHFSELIEHLYWFYNDDEISESISKATELDNILSRFGISDVKQLEVILTQKENTTQQPRILTEETLGQYGISSEEELKRLIDSRILGEEFLHYSDSNFDKFQFVQHILQRAFTNVQRYLKTLSDYDLSDSITIHKTIFTAKKDGKEIYIIARPSDYGEVILYYDAEIDTLDYTKDFELWIDNGNSDPEKLTIGKILRLTGVNRIPLRRIK